MYKEDAKINVINLFAQGRYTNRELAKMHNVSEVTVCNWLRKSQKIKYIKQKKKLEIDFNNEFQCNGNTPKSVELLDIIGRIATLIEQTKY